MKKQLKNVVTQRAIFRKHYEKLSDSEVDNRVNDFLAAGNFLTRKKLQELCGLTLSTAARHIRRMISERKIKNVNTKTHPVYTQVDSTQMEDTQNPASSL